MKKAIAATVAMLLLFLLSGCSTQSFTGFSVEELLRAPTQSAEQSAVQKALNSYLGETVQLKYPREGAQMTPYIIQDFDLDGINEAAVLYVTTAKGINVHLAMLENVNSVWEVAYEIEGLSSEVRNVELTQLSDNAKNVLVISYASTNLTDKFLALYSYQNETITPLLTQGYAEYLLHDIDNDKNDELFMVPAGVPSLQIMKGDLTAMTILQNTFLDERFSSCLNLSADSNATIAIDGITPGGAVSTELLSYSNGALNRVLLTKSKDDIFAVSRRYQKGLFSFDIDKNGRLDVPNVVASLNTLNTTRRFYYVTWNDFLLDNHEKQFGLYDAKYGYFVRLPKEWKAELELMDDGAADGGWNLRTKEGSRVVVSARISARSTADGAYTTAAVLGEKKLLLSFGSSCSADEVKIIVNGITVF